jgi:hypothetical protein
VLVRGITAIGDRADALTFGRAVETRVGGVEGRGAFSGAFVDGGGFEGSIGVRTSSSLLEVDSEAAPLSLDSQSSSSVPVLARVNPTLALAPLGLGCGAGRFCGWAGVRRVGDGSRRCG